MHSAICVENVLRVSVGSTRVEWQLNSVCKYIHADSKVLKAFRSCSPAKVNCVAQIPGGYSLIRPILPLD
jgi:hypothetical protein